MAFPDRGYDGASHFANNSNFEVQRTNHFEVVLNLADILGDGATIAEHIRLSVISISAPKVSSEAIELKHGNDTVKVAAAPKYEELTLNIHDTLGLDQLQAVQTWYNRVFDWNTKLMGMVKDYKTSGVLYMYSPDGSIVRSWILEGVWPSSFGSDSEFSYENSDGQKISITLSVDRYHEELTRG